MIPPYLDVVAVDKLVVVGVETLDDVDADDDVEIELDVEILERKREFPHELSNVDFCHLKRKVIHLNNLHSTIILCYGLK